MRLIPLLLIMACWTPTNTTAGPGFTADPPTVLAAPVKEGQAEATFAGGCFWCMEASFEKLEGVLAVESGYTGGVIEGPTYRQVANHATQHLEAVRVIYDPNKTSYETMLRAFWHNIDPFDTCLL